MSPFPKRKRHHGIRMAVHHTFRARDPQIDLPVNEALAVTLGCILVDWGRVPYPVRVEVTYVFDQGGRARVVGREYVLVFVQWMAH